MANIIPKLNLNKTPNLVENNSLVFAKNIRLDVDGTIHRDYGIKSVCEGFDTIYDKIYDDIVNTGEFDWWANRYDESYTWYKSDTTRYSFDIVGHIEDSNDFYIFISFVDNQDSGYNIEYIVRYDERTDRFYKIECNWHWSGGTITGNVINNLRNEKLLIIAESCDDVLVPIKSINLSTCTMADDESIYTQTPNIPITNIYCYEYFDYSVPNGVYQFYIRYKIRDNFYTNWFPASKELFIGNTTVLNTVMASGKYINTKKDSDTSFVLTVEHLNPKFNRLYTSFQIGFILSHDSDTVARAWKEFSFDTTKVYFDYKVEDTEEVSIEDLQSSVYQIYNVKNVDVFKTKAYIANYTEDDVNANLQRYADDVRINIQEEPDSVATYAGRPVKTLMLEDKKVISEICLDPSVDSETFIPVHCGTLADGKRDTNSLSFRLFSNNSSATNSIFNTINNQIKTTQPTTKNDNCNLTYSLYDIDCSIEWKDLTELYNETYGNDTSLPSKEKIIEPVHKVRISWSNDITKTHLFDNTHTDTDVYKVIMDYLLDMIYYLSHAAQLINNKTIKSCGSVTVELIRNFDRIDQYNAHHPKNDISQFISINIIGKESLVRLNTSVVENDFNTSTLIPNQGYSFYVHYIKQNGIATNGYLCRNGGFSRLNVGYVYKSIKDYNDGNRVKRKIYPVFSNITIPNDYIGCFFTIKHVENIVSEGIVVQHADAKNGSDIKKYVYVLDLNVGVINTYTDLNIEVPDTTYGGVSTRLKADYYNSNSTDSNWEGWDKPDPFRYFGNIGLVGLNFTDDENAIEPFTGKPVYIVQKYDSPIDDENRELVKCTPYISKDYLLSHNNSYDQYKNMNLLGFISRIYIPNYKHFGFKYFTDGSTIYVKNKGDGTGYEDLTQLDVDDTTTDAAINIPIFNEEHYIYSNQNLNLLELSENPKSKFRTWYVTKNEEVGSEVKTTKEPHVQYMELFSSILYSNIYVRPKMYFNYLRHRYYPINDNSITVFNNTIRSSILLEDEGSFNIIRFDAEDYYNVPVNRGIITNLVSVGDAILVHTQDSLFKFTGSNTLQSAQGDVAQAETQPFDTGIAEVFGSDFGFAGLQRKHCHVVTQLGYIFFDSDSKIVYLVADQGQIVKLSDTVQKLFRHETIKDCYFTNDYYNNRIFLCIVFQGRTNTGIAFEYSTTLSFSVLDSVKSFVSLHDFDFKDSFNTKTKCYFIEDTNSNHKDNIFTIDTKHNDNYNYLTNQRDFLYPREVDDDTKKFDSIIDVMVNIDFENIKTLNAVNWNSNIVEKEFKRNVNEKVAEDIINTVTPCKAMMIYTDSCSTGVIEFPHSSTGEGVEGIVGDYFKYPRWNQGFWTFNYFRNVENSNNVKPYVSDENSLIEGKYFVIRFYFDTNFKLETLKLNYNTKIYE